jgi:hypothetical protein
MFSGNSGNGPPEQAIRARRGPGFGGRIVSIYEVSASDGENEFNDRVNNNHTLEKNPSTESGRKKYRAQRIRKKSGKVFPKNNFEFFPVLPQGVLLRRWDETLLAVPNAPFPIFSDILSVPVNNPGKRKKERVDWVSEGYLRY